MQNPETIAKLLDQLSRKPRYGDRIRRPRAVLAAVICHVAGATRVEHSYGGYYPAPNPYSIIAYGDVYSDTEGSLLGRIMKALRFPYSGGAGYGYSQVSHSGEEVVEFMGDLVQYFPYVHYNFHQAWDRYGFGILGDKPPIVNVGVSQLDQRAALP